jgi:outer membrane protein assembly factor BamE (lipoprotein component of BamABCDE complex)
MKKFSVLLIVAFIAVLVLSSCNKKECPAYSKADTEQTGRNV